EGVCLFCHNRLFSTRAEVVSLQMARRNNYVYNSFPWAMSYPCSRGEEWVGYDAGGGAIPGELSMPIRDLRVTNVGPFDDMTFEFEEHINVFVGQNSRGKSTALRALADIAAYPFALPGRLCRQAPAAFTVHFVGRNGQPQELTGALPVDQDAPDKQSWWANVLTALGYSAFVPALRQNTGFRSSGPIIGTKAAAT